VIDIKQLDPKNAQQIANLAKPIWEEHYTPIIGAAQVRYMIEKFQSASAIQQQLSENYEYFEVLYCTELVGYFAVQHRPKASLFISKFYLCNQVRGKKFGSKMLNYIEQLAKNTHCQTLDLTVNKFNPAYQVYLKLGFDNVGSVEMDIGNGYIMDDYLMQKRL
jgi:diamine N-acetyltransferase